MFRRIFRLIYLTDGFLVVFGIFVGFFKITAAQVSWTEVHACRKIGQLTLRCPANHRIMIFSANYGNASGYNCSDHFTADNNQTWTKPIFSPNSSLSHLSDPANLLLKWPRCNYDMTSFVKDLCSGRDVCLIEMDEHLFRSPCDGNESLQVKFACIEGTNAISVCNRNLTSPDGHILSPGYPDYYPGPNQCSWWISTEAGKNIFIMLNDLSLRPQSAKDNACHDYLLIYENDRQLLKTCDSYPFNLQVASNQAKVSLVSTSRGWTSKGVWIYYRAIGCGNPALPYLVELVARNYSIAVLKCQTGLFFQDMLHPFGEMLLYCIDGKRWDRSVPDCVNDSDWRRLDLYNLHRSRAGTPIAMLNGITLEEIVIPSTVVGALLLVLIAILGIVLTLRRHRRKTFVYEHQEVEHLHVVRQAPRAQIDSATDLAGSYPLTEIGD